ncbi:MAG: hypothetical protein A2152_01765 [Candidatus Levybacteria bacterium RBG_16_35_6]|nr:MAG: hypothetical protein A2152_01765 [Candidatus Levybacteria bacterium RBG_16_35_6]
MTNTEVGELLPARDVIYFFNGFASGKNVYSPLTAKLAPYGKVIQQPPASIFEFKKGVDQKILDELPNNSILLSHSGGCFPAIEVAKRGRGRVKKMILITPPGLSVRSTDEWFKSFAKHTVSANIPPFESTIPIDVDFVKQLASRREQLVRQGFDLTKVDLPDVLTHIDIPILIIYANKDPLVGLPDKNFLARLGNNVKVEEVNGDHYWLVRHSQEAARKIEEFIK